MPYSDLSEFFSVIQFEIQKAFDFSFALSRAGSPDPSSPALHISLEKVELEVPVEFVFVEKEVQPPSPPEKPTVEVESPPKPLKIDLYGILKRPFNLKTLSESPTEMPKEKARTITFQVRIVGLEDAQGHPEGKPGIGRIKIIATPILR